eukprot:TRINITY_DN14115_c0_g3_i2.p1 TRINITY_DN14115_c0_g3~~TRINITY_DN14115_c0_g3_i2.p1  ORF type:complete len:107 (-),score=13.92 TRINITY_DN14115_c0_g3_i2:9-290(-)
MSWFNLSCCATRDNSNGEAGAKADIAATTGAFAYLRKDGSVVTWGDAKLGGNSKTVAEQLKEGVAKIYASSSAFAALKSAFASLCIYESLYMP